MKSESRKQKTKSRVSRRIKKHKAIMNLIIELGVKIPLGGSKEYHDLFDRLSVNLSPDLKKILRDVLQELSDIKHNEKHTPVRSKTSKHVYNKSGKSKSSYEMGRYKRY